MCPDHCQNLSVIHFGESISNQSTGRLKTYICIYILYMYLILSRYTYVFDVWQLVYFLDMLSCFVQFNLQSLCNLTMAFSANFQLAFCSIVFIWMFPKIVAHPKSSILLGFSIINHPFWGTPIFGNIQFILDSLLHVKLLINCYIDTENPRDVFEKTALYL